ncbi:hypothetical protein C8R43DRAFT_1121724 [Mycena crocata]|nr:hypothetical protein C8R43DRAFT_1121724 [Mycena crocata]
MLHNSALQTPGDLQKGEHYVNMDYFVPRSFLSQAILVYDACYQFRLPIQHASVNEDNFDDIPDLVPDDTVLTTFIDLSWAKRRRQLHTRSKL